MDLILAPISQRGFENIFNIWFAVGFEHLLPNLTQFAPAVARSHLSPTEPTYPALVPIGVPFFRNEDLGHSEYTFGCPLVGLPPE